MDFCKLSLKCWACFRCGHEREGEDSNLLLLGQCWLRARDDAHCKCYSCTITRHLRHLCISALHPMCGCTHQQVAPYIDCHSERAECAPPSLPALPPSEDRPLLNILTGIRFAQIHHLENIFCISVHEVVLEFWPPVPSLRGNNLTNEEHSPTCISWLIVMAPRIRLVHFLSFVVFSPLYLLSLFLVSGAWSCDL